MRVGMSFVIASAVASKDNNAVQGQQLRLSPYQTRGNVPMFGLHGIVSRPLPGSQVVALMRNGDPETAVGIGVNDGRYYLMGLPDGTVGLSHHQGAHALFFADRMEIDGGGKLVVVKNASKVRVEGDLECTGEITAKCDGAFVHLSTHKGHDGGGQPPTPNT